MGGGEATYFAMSSLTTSMKPPYAAHMRPVNCSEPSSWPSILASRSTPFATKGPNDQAIDDRMQIYHVYGDGKREMSTHIHIRSYDVCSTCESSTFLFRPAVPHSPSPSPSPSPPSLPSLSLPLTLLLFSFIYSYMAEQEVDLLLNSSRAHRHKRRVEGILLLLVVGKLDLLLKILPVISTPPTQTNICLACFFICKCVCMHACMR